MLPLIGYRAFQAGQPDLLGAIHPDPWRPGVNKARCLRTLPLRSGKEHLENYPDPDCGCGFNAYHSLGILKKNLNLLFPARLYGVILGWGRVEVHAEGFRAQYAKLIALSDKMLPLKGSIRPDLYPAMLELDEKYLKKAANYYQVPLLADNQLESYSQEWGQAISKDMLPDMVDE